MARVRQGYQEVFALYLNETSIADADPEPVEQVMIKMEYDEEDDSSVHVWKWTNVRISLHQFELSAIIS